jgi:hypothetical protein
LNQSFAITASDLIGPEPKNALYHSTGAKVPARKDYLRGKCRVKMD